MNIERHIAIFNWVMFIGGVLRIMLAAAIMATVIVAPWSIAIKSLLSTL